MQGTHLSWVLSNTVASVEYGNRRELGSDLSTSSSRVTKNDGVAVAAEGPDGVGESLSLGDGRGVGGDRND